MEKNTGIGGVFFRAKDPGALAKWYETHLGINPAPKDMTPPLRVSDAGVTVFHLSPRRRTISRKIGLLWLISVSFIWMRFWRD